MQHASGLGEVLQPRALLVRVGVPEPESDSSSVLVKANKMEGEIRALDIINKTNRATPASRSLLAAMSSTTTVVAPISAPSRHRSSPHRRSTSSPSSSEPQRRRRLEDQAEAQQHAPFAQPPDPDSGYKRRVSFVLRPTMPVTHGGFTGSGRAPAAPQGRRRASTTTMASSVVCNYGIRGSSPSPVTLSTAPTPGTIMARFDGDRHSGEGGDGGIMDEFDGADSHGGSGGGVPVSGSPAAAVDHHEQDRHGADAESVDALADHDRNFHTEIRHFFLQDLDPEEIEQLHIAMREYNTGVLLRFAPRIAQAISDGRLRDPRPRQDTAAPTTASDQLAYRYGGFGGVPASAAAIAGLERRNYDDDDGAAAAECVICMVDYEAGDEISVMPCTKRHMFHVECLGEWLARSHLCPLCRHALPTEVHEAS